MNNISNQGFSQEVGLPDSAPCNDIPTYLDIALAAADRELGKTNAIHRSEAVCRNLKDFFGDVDLKRLAYAPQPHASEFIAPHITPALFPEELDISYQILLCSANCILNSTDLMKQYELAGKLRDKGIRFLTLIDTAACLLETQWSSIVKEVVGTLYALLQRCVEVSDSFWYKDSIGPGGPYEKAEILKLIHNAKAYVFVGRLVFFICRLSDASMDEFDHRVERVTSVLGVPPVFNIFDELQRLQLRIDANYNETKGASERNVQMNGRRPPILVIVVAALVDRPCNHQEDLDWWDSASRNVIIIQYWASWLSKERQLQMEYETERD